MDTLFNMSASLYWQIPLGILLLVLAVFLVWLASRIARTLKSVENLLDKSFTSLLKATEDLVGIHQDVSTLLKSVDGTVTELNRELPQLLENINRITASIQQISESEIQPITHNIQEITDTLNQNIAKVDEIIDTVRHFSQTTVKHAEYYRDRFSDSATDVISAWNAVKASWEVFSQPRKSGTSDSKDSTQ